MLTIERCREILNKTTNGKQKGRIYTDSEIEQIKDFLYHLAKIDVASFKEHLKSKK